jgi:hypothetical protein
MNFSLISVTPAGSLNILIKLARRFLKEGEEQQFSKKLRFIPEKRRGDDGGRERMGDDGGRERMGGGQFGSSWRSEGSGGRSGQGGSGSKYSPGRSGSDAPSWRKEDGSKNKEEGV